MPRSTSYLPDVNVWLALASRRHIHAEICAEWFESVQSGQVMFCRVTQMGLLRLLTQEAAMGGDVLTCRKAWRVYHTFLEDERIGFSAEPFTVEQEWAKLTGQDRPEPRAWTDRYLAAFAKSAGLRLVTLDRASVRTLPGALLLT